MCTCTCDASSWKTFLLTERNMGFSSSILRNSSTQLIVEWGMHVCVNDGDYIICTRLVPTIHQITSGSCICTVMKLYVVWYTCSNTRRSKGIRCSKNDAQSIRCTYIKLRSSARSQDGRVPFYFRTLIVPWTQQTRKLGRRQTFIESCTLLMLFARFHHNPRAYSHLPEPHLVALCLLYPRTAII